MACKDLCNLTSPLSLWPHLLLFCHHLLYLSHTGLFAIFLQHTKYSAILRLLYWLYPPSRTFSPQDICWLIQRYTLDTCQLLTLSVGFSGGSVLKNLSSMQEAWVQSPGWEDPLEKERATHSSIRAWEIPWTEEPGRVQSMGVSKELDTI